MTFEEYYQAVQDRVKIAKTPEMDLEDLSDPETKSWVRWYLFLKGFTIVDATRYILLTDQNLDEEFALQQQSKLLNHYKTKPISDSF